ncbi:hypothetical protein BH23CHL7_BH23CHL7_05790 [soil metagenome]
MRNRLFLSVAVAALAVALAAAPVGARIAGGSTGGGKMLVLGTMMGSFRYAALANDAGGAKGNFHFELELQGQHVEFDGAVTCVTFDSLNQRAWIGGVVTDNNSEHPSYTTPRTQVGEDIWFRVVDYGEGANDPEDRTTFVGFAGDRAIATSAEYCELQPWVDGDASTWPVVHGNLQVRP